MATDPSHLGSQVKEAFAAADVAAAERIQNLQWVHQARGTQFAREAADLKAEYGATHVAVKRAEDAAAAAKAAVTRLSSLHRQMTTEAPPVAPGGWALHGHVSTGDGKPVRGFTVFLVDAANAYQERYGFANTDAAGRFILASKPADAPSGKETKAAAAAAPAQEPDLFITVADLRGRTVYRDATPFARVPGSVTYKDIDLADGAPPMGQPPGDVKKVVPKPTRKK